jgi:hypothetical protein
MEDIRTLSDEEQTIYIKNHPLYLVLNPDIALHQSKLNRIREVYEILDACKNKKSLKQMEEEKKKIYEQYNSDEEDEAVIEERCKKIAMVEYGNISNQELEDLINEKDSLMYWIIDPKNHAIVSAKNKVRAFERTKERILRDLKEQDRQKLIELKEEAKKKKLEIQLKVLQLKAEGML